VVAGGAATDETVSNANANGENEVIINNGAMFNRRRFGRGGMVLNPMQPQAAGMPAGGGAPAAGGAETIAQVIPVDDKIIVATNAGQIFAIQIGNGSLAWHTRLSAAGAISRLAANDDFTVAKVDDAASTQLVALDTLTGQLVKRMTFANESGNVPVNVALAPDGTMVWIQQDRLCGKDLFEPRKEPNYEIIAGQVDAGGVNGRVNANIQVDGQVFSPIYAGAVNPDQLLISEGRILVVTHTGRFVSLHSLETGKLLDYTTDGKRAEARLATVHGEATKPVNDWGVGLHLVGSKLYVCTRENGPVAYNLDKAGPLWGGSLDNNTSSNLQFDEPFIGQDHLVLIDRPTGKAPGGAGPAAPGAPGVPNRGPNVNPAAAAPNAPPAGTNTIRLYCYARSVDAESGHESGTVDHFPYVRDDNGIREIQGVDGGFYYLTGDKKLHFLKGSRP
jgi:hypothetical protein